jgi:hypothetical protein
MVAAHRQAALLAADRAGTPVVVTPAARPVEAASAGARRPSWLDAVSWRRPAAALMAGCLTLGMLAGTALAVRPGGPLYAARIWTEAANLPAADEQLARAQAEIQRLGARLDEVEAAAAADDGPALTAALEAYAAIVSEAAAGTAGDAAAEQAVQLAIERHMLVLTALAATVPGPAQAALQHAIASSAEALGDIDHAGGGPGVNGNGPGTNNGNGPSENSNNGGGNNGAPVGGGNAGEKPDATPVPDPTATPKPPKPTPTSPSHDRTPRPTPEHQPPGQGGGPPSDPPSQEQQ